MKVMLDTADDLDVAAAELGCEVEQLFTPLTRRKPKRPDQPFAIDNGAFSRFDEFGFVALLQRHEARQKLCRFVVVPDVPFSARRTLEVFERWEKRHELDGWRLALAMQDGQEDMPIPWELFACAFIGGSTKWKDGPAAAAIVKAAIALGKWVHVGRVNTPGRFERFEALGAHSIDGTGLAQYTHMRCAIADRHNRPLLIDS
jgi:hypothetical protein